MGLFSRKTTTTQIDPRSAEQKAKEAFLQNFMQTYASKYEPQKPYTGKFTAGMSPYEGRGLQEFLTQYLNAPDVSPELQGARDFFTNTMKGTYNPDTSPEYRAYRDTAKYNRDQAIKDTNAALGARGKFFSSEAVNKYGDINAQTANALNTENARLADKERSRAEGAAGKVAGLEQYISGIPLQKATAATTTGALPRLLEQADLEAVYQDFLRRQKEGQGAVATAAGAQYTEPYTIQSTKPSTFESFIAPVLKTFVGTGTGQFNPLSLFGLA